jgi:hypothetical protein
MHIDARNTLQHPPTQARRRYPCNKTLSERTVQVYGIEIPLITMQQGGSRSAGSDVFCGNDQRKLPKRIISLSESHAALNSWNYGTMPDSFNENFEHAICFQISDIAIADSWTTASYSHCDHEVYKNLNLHQATFEAPTNPVPGTAGIEPTLPRIAVI